MGGGPFAQILTKDQNARLKQLSIQFEAPMSMMQPDINKQLELSNEQREKINDIIRNMMPPPPQGQGGPGGGPGFGGPPQGGQGGFGGGQGQGGPPQGGPGFGGPGGQGGPQGQPPKFSEMQAKKAAALKEVMKVLTSDQKETWSKITGKEFTKWEEPKRPNN
jgi:hypothetical protein